MGKVEYLNITESILELKILASKQKNLKGEKRVKSLIYIKENKI
jgi:hypothetical protein